MNTFTVVQVSDTHLSATHAYFQDNWDVFVEEMQERKPDLVIHSGDVSFNGPDARHDLEFARVQLDRLPCPWLIVPGNHDVGEPGENPRLDQPVSDALVESWNALFGRDRFCEDRGGWRLIGLNSEIMGSGLAREAEQLAFLDDALKGADGRAIGLFLHKPFYIIEPDETDTLAYSVLPAAREDLLNRIRAAGVRFVSNGHNHSYLSRDYDGIEFVWCPTSAFIIPAMGRLSVPAVPRAGYVVWRFDGTAYEQEFVEPALFTNMEITNWTRQRGSSITLPPRPLRPGQ